MNDSTGSSFNLDILTVSFHSESVLEENIRLMQRLNPGFKYRLIIVDNAKLGILKSSGENILVIDGPNPDPTHLGDGSYHHAAGLMEGMKHVKAPHLLVMDPDFFVVQSDWMFKVIERMNFKNLSFWGSTWLPTKLRKYRNFPSVHFMMIDLGKVPLGKLDFMPDVIGMTKINDFIERLPLSFGFRRSLLVGFSRDTGWKLKRDFGFSQKHMSETLVASVQYKDIKNLVTKFPFPKKWRDLVPNRFNLIPLKQTYTYRSFVAEKLKNYDDFWEEFWLDDKPFGIHLRQVGRSRTKEGREEDSRLIKTLTREIAV